MKKLFTILLVAITLSAFAQVPQRINYQGAARYNNGTPMANKQIALKFEITHGAGIYTETQPGISTSPLGIFNTHIGLNGNLSTVNWKSNTSLTVLIDTLNGSNFTPLFSQTLAAVPYALSAPEPSLNLANGILSVGSNTVFFPTAGLQNLTISGSSLSITGGNSVVLPPTTLTGSGGGVTVSPIAGGYNINTPSVALIGGYNGFPSGLLQIKGSYPTYSLLVAPDIVYNPNTGDLVIQSFAATGAPTYIYPNNITPNLTLYQGTYLRVGPTTNTVNPESIAPWRFSAPSTVTLASIGHSVGIGVYTPSAQLHVDGYTRLSNSGPNIQILRRTGTTASTQGGATSISLPAPTVLGVTQSFTQNNILSITVMVDASSTNAGDWIHAGNTVLPNSEFNWQIIGGNIVITNKSGSSSAILNRPIKVMITFEE